MSSQRRNSGRRASEGGLIRLTVLDGMGKTRHITADLVDLSDGGMGVYLVAPLEIGSSVEARGRLRDGQGDGLVKLGVRWCVELPNGRFHAGLEFADGGKSSGNGNREIAADPRALDCYEVLQVSPNADAETIDRVYRLLAQRYHPDNTRTGHTEMFIQLTEAYHILSDPERRAGYDAKYRENRKIEWNIFDRSVVATGPEAEKRKRQGILGVLYAQALHDPDGGTINIRKLEELLGCPREHLQAALWYLRGKGFIERSDNGRYTITVEGFDEVEGHSATFEPRSLLEAASTK